MTLPEQLSRRFTNTQIEVREPLRRELDILTAEYLARGGNVVELPNRLGTPRPIVQRTQHREPPPNLYKHINRLCAPWTNQLENSRMYELSSTGKTCKEIAVVLDREFNSGRTQSMIRQALNRHAAGSLGKSNKTPDYLPIEDDWITFLNKYGFTPKEIAQALNQFIGHLYRSDRAIKERSLRMGLANNRKGPAGRPLRK